MLFRELLIQLYYLRAMDTVILFTELSIHLYYLDNYPYRALDLAILFIDSC